MWNDSKITILDVIICYRPWPEQVTLINWLTDQGTTGFASSVLLHLRSGSVKGVPSKEASLKTQEPPVLVPNIPCLQPQAYLPDI